VRCFLSYSLQYAFRVPVGNRPGPQTGCLSPRMLLLQSRAVVICATVWFDIVLLIIIKKGKIKLVVSISN